MKLKIFILNLIFFISISGFAQTHFQKLYGTGGDDYGNKIVPAGNGYIVGGSSTSGVGGYDAILEAMDSTGTLLWAHEYGGSRTEYGSGLTAGPSSVAMTGRTNSFSSNNSEDVYLLNAGYNGALNWVKGYHTDSVDIGAAIGQASTYAGGYLLTGQTNAYSAGGNDLFVILTDTNGNLKWAKTYGGTGDESGILIFGMNGGGFLAAGTSNSNNSGFNQVYAIIGDSMGNPQLQLLLSGTGDVEGQGLVGGSNNTAYIAGTSGALGQDKFFLASINTNTFTLNWAKVYGGSTGVAEFSTIQQLPNGNMILTGNTTSFGNANGANGLVIEVDTAGNVQWADVVGDTGSTYMTDILTLGDTTAVITGYTDSFNLAGHNDFYLAHFASNGALCTNSESVNITVTSWTPTFTASPTLTGFSSQTATFVTYTPAFVENSNTASTDNVCSEAVALAVNAGRDTTVCSNNNSGVILGGNPTATGGVAPYTYSWSGGGLSNDTLANPEVQPTASAVYTVIVTDHAGTTASAQVSVSTQICTGIKNIENADFSVVPNPSNGNVQLNFVNDAFTDAQLNVFDITGRIVYATKISSTPTMKLSLNYLPTGPYIIQITNAGQIISNKLIIE